MNEIWKDVVGYEGLYQVSNLGNVRSVERTINMEHPRYGSAIVKYESKELRGYLNERGYRKVCLTKNKHSKIRFVHRLVAEAFIPNPNKLPQINHKDEDKTNNHVDNLEWCTNKYNTNYGEKRKQKLSINAKNRWEKGKFRNKRKELIEQQAVIDCLTNTAKYYEREDADEWTKGIHYGLLHGLDNILDNVPIVEAIPKDQYEEQIKTNNRLVTDNKQLRADIVMMRLDYEAKLKADMVAMLEDLDLQIDESAAYNREYAKIQRLIRDRIDKLKGEEDGNK